MHIVTFNIEYYINNIGIRDYILFILIAATIIVPFIGIMKSKSKFYYAFLILLTITTVILYADITYHQIQYDLSIADQYIAEEDYQSAYIIYEKILLSHPGLPEVVKRRDCIYDKYVEQYYETIKKRKETFLEDVNSLLEETELNIT